MPHRRCRGPHVYFYVQSCCNSHLEHDGGPETPQSIPVDEPSNPRHKAVGGLRPSKNSAITVVTEDIDFDNDVDSEHCLRPPNVRIEPSIRQFQSDTRFPQRKRRANDSATPTLQPSSIDKLISGIWRQVHSPVTLSVAFPVSSLHDDTFRAHQR